METAVSLHHVHREHNIFISPIFYQHYKNGIKECLTDTRLNLPDRLINYNCNLLRTSPQTVG